MQWILTGNNRHHLIKQIDEQAINLINPKIKRHNFTYKSLTYFKTSSEKLGSFLMIQDIQISFKTVNSLDEIIKNSKTKPIRIINQKFSN